MLTVGFVGWRGMVGSVLMQRMHEENDFKKIEAVFFSTSQAGEKGPDGQTLKDAYNLIELAHMTAIVSCQGSDYTREVYLDLRRSGWKGYWIDAASSLRMESDSVIILDPVNLDVIQNGIKNGIRTFIGGNCTVSLMLMGIAGLFKADLVEWMSTMTYQSASGAGAKNMLELTQQMQAISKRIGPALNPGANALEIDQMVSAEIRSAEHPTSVFGAPLAASLIPWIDSAVADGQTKEEWKGFAETNKILGRTNPIPIDGICVRAAVMRCHSQAITLKLKKDAPLDELTQIIAGSTPWTRIVPNDKASTLAGLTPAKVSGTLEVPVGRIHKLKMGPEYLGLFTCGDQLLWGAAEPLRRMINIILEYPRA